MAKNFCAAALVLLAGCATLQPVPLTVPESKHVEDEPLPTDPATEKVASPDGDWVVPLNEEDCITKDGKLVSDAPKPCPGKGGLLFSEEKAARLKLYQIGYIQLRGNYIADRRVWLVHRELYESRLKDAGEALQRAQPSWFEKHSFQLGVLGGAVIGAGMAVGIIYAVAPAFKAAPAP
jgi:hypothetical protein